MRVVAALVAVVGCVLAYQATRAAIALSHAATEARTVVDQARDGDVPAARRTAEDLRRHADVARRSTDGVLWAATTLVPVVGDHTLAVRQTAAAVDELADGALPAALGVADDLSGGRLRGADGGFDLDVVADLRAPLAEATTAVGRAHAELDEVRPGLLVPPLREPVSELGDRLAELDEVMDEATTTVGMLPELMGADGPRTYLLVVQNNAELRATGGLPGSVQLLRVDDGRLELGSQGGAGTYGIDGPPVVELTRGERELLGATMATDFRDSNATPDFPRAATIMARMTDRSVRPPVDGVITIDPVTLASVLEATGPVEVGGSELTADNAVRRLLFDPYQELPTDRQQNRYFAATSKAILDALLGDRADVQTLVAKLADGVRERRVMIWSRDAGEQRALVAAGVAGALPTGQDRPEVGFYLNDGVAAKVQYFLRYDADVRSLGCTPDGRQLVQARMRLVSKVPTPVSQLTYFVVGKGWYVPPGDNLVNLAMFAPAGGSLQALQVDGKPAEVASGEISGRGVTVLPVRLAPGESTEVVANFSTAVGEHGDPRMEWTPSIEPGPSEVAATSRCR